MEYQNLRAESVTKHITRIIDTDVYLYLIEGQRKACLIDTGHGIGDNLKKVVETLTDKPVFVILTHNHEDHIGGSGWFNEVYLNAKDHAGYHELADPEIRFCRHQNPTFGHYPLSAYAPELKTPHMLTDGQEFDLGAITVKTIACSGHTAGSMIVLIKEEQVAIYGDAIGRRVCLIHPGLTVSQYLESLRYVQSVCGQIVFGLRCHNDPVVSPTIVDELAECCQRILKGTDARQNIQFKHVDGSLTCCFAASAVSGPAQARIDGKQGNIFYTLDNVV